MSHPDINVTVRGDGSVTVERGPRARAYAPPIPTLDERIDALAEGVTEPLFGGVGEHREACSRFWKNGTIHRNLIARINAAIREGRDLDADAATLRTALTERTERIERLERERDVLAAMNVCDLDSCSADCDWMDDGPRSVECKRMGVERNLRYAAECVDRAALSAHAEEGA